MADGKLLLEIGERIKLVGSVEFLIVFAVAALDLAIVPWSIGTDELVANVELSEGSFKERRFVLFTSMSRLVNSEPLSV